MHGKRAGYANSVKQLWRVRQCDIQLVSFENSFTQKVLLFLFTWGSASSRFHLEVPARMHVPSAKDSFSCKGV